MRKGGWSRAPRRPACRCRRGRAVSDVKQAAPSRAWAWLGLRLVETGEGAAVVERTTTEDRANHSGCVHGGRISTLAYSAMGRSVRTLKPSVVRAMGFDLTLSVLTAANG